MSASTIRTTIRLGEATMRELAARREELSSEQRVIAGQLSRRWQEEYQRQGIQGATHLAELVSRCEALEQLSARHRSFAEVISAQQLTQTRELLSAAAQKTGYDPQLASQVEKLEQRAFDRWGSREASSRALDLIADTQAAAIEHGSRRWEPDGRMVGTVAFNEGGRMEVAVRADKTEATKADWDAAGSDIRGDGTQEDACRQQRAKVDSVAQEIDMTIEGEESEPLDRYEAEPKYRGAEGPR